MGGRIRFALERFDSPRHSSHVAQLFSLGGLRVTCQMIDMLVYALKQLVTELPMILVGICCIVAGFVFWRRAPSSSLYLILGCSLSLALLFIYPFAWAYVLAHDDQGAPGIRMAFSFGWSVFRSLFLILMVVAIYSGRKQP